MEMNLDVLQKSSVELKKAIKEELNNILIEVFATNDVEGLKNTAVLVDQKEDYEKQLTKLNKLYKEIDDNRKDFKKAVTKPYEDFNKIYKTEFEKPLLDVKEHFKSQVDKINQDIVDNKIKELETYLAELIEDKEYPKLTLEKLGISVNRSDSITKLKKDINKEIERIDNDINVINGMEKAEILLKTYKESYNLATAIETANHMMQIIGDMAVDKDSEDYYEDEELVEVEVKEEKEFTLKVVGSRSQMKELREFLESKNIKYDVLG